MNCVFVSSNWGPLTVSAKQHPWNPLGQFRQLVQSLGDPSSGNLRSSCWAGSQDLESKTNKEICKTCEIT